MFSKFNFDFTSLLLSKYIFIVIFFEKKNTRIDFPLLYEKLNSYRKVAKKLKYSSVTVYKYINSVESVQKSENFGRPTLLNERINREFRDY